MPREQILIIDDPQPATPMAPETRAMIRAWWAEQKARDPHLFRRTALGVWSAHAPC